MRASSDSRWLGAGTAVRGFDRRVGCPEAERGTEWLLATTEPERGIKVDTLKLGKWLLGGS